MTWREIAIDGLHAAGELSRLGRHRSSVSRAYYAAFAALTARLTEAGLSFGGDEGPAHSAVPELIQSNMPRLRVNERRALKGLFTQLYENRLDADYHASITVDGKSATLSLRCVGFVFQILGIRP